MFCLSRTALLSIKPVRTASIPAVWRHSAMIHGHAPKCSSAYTPTAESVGKHVARRGLVIKQGCLSSTIKRSDSDSSLATRPRCLEFVRSRGEFLGLPALPGNADLPVRRLRVTDRLRALAVKGFEAFMPADYKNTVTPEYIPYTKWQFIHNVFGAASGVLSTQAMLYAMGLGAGSLPLSAAINWVIKDGFGQLGGVVYATLVGQRFDSDPKHQRFWSTVWLQCATWLEMLTPLVPHLFLVIGSVANVGKNISWLAIFATKASVNRNFCRKENLGDVTAKFGSQATAAGLLGTATGVLIGATMDGSMYTLLIAFVPLSLISLWANHISLFYAITPSLNLERARLLVGDGAITAVDGKLALDANAIKAPREVAKTEEFVRQVHHITPTADLPGIVVSRRLDKVAHDMPARRSQESQDRVAHMVASAIEQQTGAPNENYYIGYLPESTAYGSKNGNVYLWFGDKASNSDMLLAFYNAMVLRQLHRTESDMKEAARRAHGFARGTFSDFSTALKQQGWDTETIFFTKESRRICVEDTARDD